MSNTAIIEQRTIIIKWNRATEKEIFISDNYANGTILLIDKNLYDNKLDMLEIILEEIKDADYPGIRGVLDYVKEEKKGISIDGVWYEWIDIRPIFDKVGY